MAGALRHELGFTLTAPPAADAEITGRREAGGATDHLPISHWVSPAPLSHQASKGDPGLVPRLLRVLASLPSLRPVSPLRPGLPALGLLVTDRGCLQTPLMSIPQPTLLVPHPWQVMLRPNTVSASPTGDVSHFFSSARACVCVYLFGGLTYRK